MQALASRMEAVKKIAIESEWSRLFVLTVLVFYAYGIFLSGNNIGAADAHWYHNILRDALIQLDHGIFPVYVGQSQFNFFGSSDFRSPYYLMFGQLLHILTLGQLSSLYIQHLTVVVSAFGAAFITYFLLTQLAPQRRWISLLFAFLYITCPGVIGLIFRCDMYHAFMLVPYIPLAIYGLVRTHQKNDYWGYLITAAALALALMAHPPIAIWTMGICFFFYGLRILFLRKGFISLLLVPGLIALLNFWQFASIQSLGLRNYLTEMPNPGYLNWIMHILNNSIPGVLLPLGWASSQTITPFLQLGYSFGLIVLLGLMTSLRFSSNFITRALVACALILLVLLYPFPFLTHFLWSLVPNGLHTLTIWPMQRFYIILAALISFIGILIIKKASRSATQSMSRLFVITLVLMFSWNLYQTFYFVNYGQTVARSTDNFWQSPENMYFIANGLLPIHNDINAHHFDPRLKNSLLNAKMQPIAGYNNEEAVIHECTRHLTTPKQDMVAKTHETFPVRMTSAGSRHILNFLTPPEKHLLLCLKTDLNFAGINVEVIKPQNKMNTSLDASIGAHQSKGPSTKVIAIPIFHNKPEDLSVYASAALRNDLKPHQNSAALIKSYALISYDPEKLPIRITSFTPYMAQLKTTTHDSYLKIFKEYLPGYTAKVDGVEVPVLPSPKRRMVMIPIKGKGTHTIELFYVGTPLMRISFYISTFSWIMLICIFAGSFYRRYLLKTSDKPALAFSSKDT